MSKNIKEDNLAVKTKRAIFVVSRFNVGILVFLVFLAYILISIVRSATKTHLSIYEVPVETIATDNRAVGVIIREETAITSEKAGYVNYYLKGGTRVSKGKTVFSLDDNKQIYNYFEDSDMSYSLSETDIKELKRSISQFQDSYENRDYSEIYSLQESLEGKIRNISDTYLLDNLQTILESTGITSSLKVYKTPSAGVISYYTDDLENITLNDISTELFQKYDGYKINSLYGTDIKENGATVYKLLTNENWMLVINLTKEQYEALEGKTKITFTINKDRLTLTENVSLYQLEGGYFARVEMEKYMVRYYDERFLSVSLNLDSESGLKIPNTSITEKDFYMIPIDYLTHGGDSTDYGITISSYNAETGKLTFDLLAVEIYHMDEEYAYVDTGVVAHGTYIYNTTTEQQFQVSMVKKLIGVYCTNKGYAQFKRIEKLYEGDDYTIVKEGLPLSINEHDHIALDASKIDESAIIY